MKGLFILGAAVVTLLFISFLFSLFAEPAKAPTTLSLNQLVEKINAGQVTKIIVNSSDLAVTMKDGSQAVAEKETESGISETLKNLNVSSTALAGVDLEVQNPSGWGHTCIGDNCQSSSMDVLAKCCAYADGWTPSWYAVPPGPPPGNPLTGL